MVPDRETEKAERNRFTDYPDARIVFTKRKIFFRHIFGRRGMLEGRVARKKNAPGGFVVIAVFVQRSRGDDGEPPAGALGRVLAHVRAIATDEEVGIEVELDVFPRMSVSGIFDVIRIQAVEAVDAGHGNGLVAVREVFDVAKRSGGNEFVLGVDVGIEAEQIDGQLAVGDDEIVLNLVQGAHPLGAGRSIIDVFFHVAVTGFGHLPFPAAVDRDEQRIAAFVLLRVVRAVA